MPQVINFNEKLKYCMRQQQLNITHATFFETLKPATEQTSHVLHTLDLDPLLLSLAFLPHHIKKRAVHSCVKT